MGNGQGTESGESHLIDSYGRTIDYLRLSITDRCNLRCLYCMPPEGVQWIPHGEVLRFEEILKICRILAGLGIKAVRVTGGEPLVRRGVVDLIRELKAESGIERVTITSNGVLLGEYIEALAAAGLDAVNISLDTVNEEKFRSLARGEGLDKIMSAIDRALDLGMELKINCVPLAGINDDDIAALAGLAQSRNISVRFIELMPLGAASAFTLLPADKVIALMENTYGPMRRAEEQRSPYGKGPAEYYTLNGFTGLIGLISPMSRCFCGKCNRLRLSSSGILKPCLSSDLSLDLRSRLRAHASDGEIAETVREFVMRKPAGHSFTGTAGTQNHDSREMFRIGG